MVWFFHVFFFNLEIFDARIIIFPSVILFEMRLVAKGTGGGAFFSTFHGICLDGAAVNLIFLLGLNLYSSLLFFFLTSSVYYLFLISTFTCEESSLSFTYWSIRS
ncbi:hypothetical protein DFP73DRAFT_367382 [Morchella snyderi]|nr:hypothetical protein DFP73DRAFT_367382 [Morchella snyderi]